MISFLRGKIAWIEEDKVTLDVNGMGYGVYMSGYDMGLLPPGGKEVMVYTYLHVKEDAMQLFGFLTRDALAVFKLLITVNGIGPKGALGILTALTPDDLRYAVVSNDIKAICAAPGIGKKTAEKLVLELKDKLRLEDALEHLDESVRESAGNTALFGDVQADAVQALVALGYGNTEALKAVRQVEITEMMSVEDVLKQSLKHLSL